MYENQDMDSNAGEQSNSVQQSSAVPTSVSESAVPVQPQPLTNDKQNKPKEDIVEPTANQTSSMEVHHPHHLTHKKKWSEYILEFLMLFFAVFLGFLVENFREHRVEQERTEKHMHTMVENLKYDTTRYGLNLRRNVQIGKGLDSFRREMQLAVEGTMNSNMLYYYYWKYARGYNQPIINDGAMSQLKSSGMLRMIKNDSLVNEIGDYYGRRVYTMESSNDAILRSRASLFEIAKQVFSYKGFDEFIERETTFSAVPNTWNDAYFAGIIKREPTLKLLPSATANFERLYNEIAFYQMALRNFNSFIQYNHQGADSLLSHINEVYHFEEN